MSLIFPLGFLFLSQTLASEPKCFPHQCLPGYFKKTSCGPNNTFNLCETCQEGYFTELNNTKTECFQCSYCGRNMVPKKKCTTNSNVECVCKENHYESNDNCYSCASCKRSDCNLKCNLIRPPTTSPTTLSMTSTTTERHIHTTEKAVHSLNYIVWVFLLLLMLLVMYCVPVMFIRNLYKYLHLCPRWRDKQDLETPVQNSRDPGSLQSPTTLTFTISEETPIMEVKSAAPPEHPVHTSPLLPNGETRVYPDLSKPWPAIVLYSVIKEVPLRRWKEFLRLLSVADHQLERVELDAGLSSTERQYQMLRLWSQMPSANMDEIYSALHYMELPGCAQMLRESLEKLQWRPPGVTV